MDETMIPVCSPEYARRFELEGNLANLAHVRFLHDRQAWSYDSGTDEWHSWLQHFGIDIDSGMGTGFDRSDLAVIVAMNDAGVAMGRKRLVQKRLDKGELVAPFPDMELKCSQYYYVSALSERS
jgi:LysR family D-serine deaminase transcriptional activator